MAEWHRKALCAAFWSAQHAAKSRARPPQEARAVSCGTRGLRRHFEHAAARCADGGDECAQGADGRDEAADARAGEHGPGLIQAVVKPITYSPDRLDGRDYDVGVDEEDPGGYRVEDEGDKAEDGAGDEHPVGSARKLQRLQGGGGVHRGSARVGGRQRRGRVAYVFEGQPAANVRED